MRRRLARQGSRGRHCSARLPFGMVKLAPRVVADPAVCHGHPIVAGTRVLVSVVVGQLSSGASVDDVVAEYGVTRDDVLAALAYAAAVVSTEEVRAL